MNAKQILTEAGLAKSHWGARIIQAEEKLMFTPKDRYDSGEWVTCACGIHVPKELKIVTVPADNTLIQHGIDFCGYVGKNNFIESANTLIAIEVRAGELLADLKEN